MHFFSDHTSHEMMLILSHVVFFKVMNQVLNLKKQPPSPAVQGSKRSPCQCVVLYTVKINVAESPPPPRKKKEEAFSCLGNVCVCILFPFNFYLEGYYQCSRSLSSSIPWKLQVCCTYCQQLSCKLRPTFTMRL